MKRGVLLAAVPLLFLVGGVAWIVGRDRAARSVERADNPRVALQADIHADVATETTPLESRSAEQGEAGSPEKVAPSSSEGTGTLRIRVLDEKTRAPVPDLQFVAYRERGGPKVLGTGTTDKDGRAELPEIEANTVIVRTQRKPPYAEQTNAAWLKPGATKELELLVGPGSAITGRVIDDLARPVEGAELYHFHYTWAFEDLSRGAREPEARSGSDGRFRLENLSSRPRSVWVVDGAMRPESWEPVLLQATRENISTGLTAIPLPGKDVDVGDIRLTRASIFAGHLLDASGKLVAGAVISLQGELDRGPSDPEFHLASGDILTDAAGSFELHAAPGPTHVVVWTREGEHQRLRLPQGKPGERLVGVELRLSPEIAFELEFVDASGAPAPIPAPNSRSPGVSTPWQSRYSESEQLSVLARSSDGARERGSCERCDPDGKWRLHLPIDPHAVGEFEVGVAGYAREVERSGNGFPPLVQRKIVLTPYPVFHVRLVPKNPEAKLLEGQGVYVTLQICMADPERHAAADGRCCGLGAFWNEPWRGQALDLALPVRRNSPYWIYARGPRPEPGSARMSSIGYAGEGQHSGGFGDLKHIGPFQPGPEVRELVLDPADFAWPETKSEPRKPPEPSAPGEDHSASLRAHITDARSGKPVSRAWIAVGNASATADGSGDVKGERLPAGSGQARVSARGYLTVELGERTLHERETLDLGEIVLEPRARHRGRILDADGVALPHIWLGIVPNGTPVEQENGGGTTAPDGSFELFGELGSSFVLQTVSPAMHAGWGGQAQRFALETWPVDEVKELRCARFRKVVVTLGGVDPDEREVVPFVCPAPGEPTATCDHRQARVPQHEELARGLAIASSEAGLRYAFLLAPGKYVAWGSSLMHELPPTEFEVTPGDTDIELTISAH